QPLGKARVLLVTVGARAGTWTLGEPSRVSLCSHLPITSSRRNTGRSWVLPGYHWFRSSIRGGPSRGRNPPAATSTHPRGAAGRSRLGVCRPWLRGCVGTADRR